MHSSNSDLNSSNGPFVGSPAEVNSEDVRPPLCFCSKLHGKLGNRHGLLHAFPSVNAQEQPGDEPGQLLVSALTVARLTRTIAILAGKARLIGLKLLKSSEHVLELVPSARAVR